MTDRGRQLHLHEHSLDRRANGGTESGERGQPEPPTRTSPHQPSRNNGREPNLPPPTFTPAQSEWCRRVEVLALIDHYIGVFPDDAQVLGYLRQALEIGMELHTQAAKDHG